MGGASTSVTRFAIAATDSFTTTLSDGLMTSSFETRPSYSMRSLTTVENLEPEGTLVVGCIHAL